jgi:hypothetical protein
MDNFVDYGDEEDLVNDLIENNILNLSYGSSTFRELSNYVRNIGARKRAPEYFMNTPWDTVIDCADNLFLQVADAINFNGLTRLQKYGVLIAVFSIVLKNFTENAEYYMPFGQYMYYLDERGIDMNDQQEEDLRRFIVNIEIEILTAVNWVPCSTFRQRGLF